MGEIVGLFLLVIASAAFLVWMIAKSASGHSGQNTGTPPRPAARTMRCPNCGSPATVHGNSWECGWCGDFGSLR